jgi:ParB family chromosome partitioning protein
LAAIDANLDESMGVRQSETHPDLSPVPHEKDVGRRPLAHVGRLDVEQVIPDPDQPRMEFTDEAIDRLADSIREKGQLSPIRVRWSEDIAKWIIVAGERRWRATKRAGLSTIDCYFHEQPLSESQILEEQLIENCLREDLLPLEEARAFEKLMALNGWNAKRLAEALRVHPSKVSRGLSLLRLPEDIQDDLAAGKIPGRIAHEISKIDDPVVQRTLATRARDGRLTHAQAAGAVRQRRGKRRAKARGTKQTFLTESGWRIVVSVNRCGTYHEIEEALIEVLEEVRHRIDNNVQLF